MTPVLNSEFRTLLRMFVLVRIIFAHAPVGRSTPPVDCRAAITAQDTEFVLTAESRMEEQHAETFGADHEVRIDMISLRRFINSVKSVLIWNA